VTMARQPESNISSRTAQRASLEVGSRGVDADHGMVLGQRRRLTLPEEASASIRALILSGEFRPGQFLRIDRLVEVLGMSQTPIREALLVLQSDGLVRHEVRRGFVVSEISPRDIEDIFLVQSWVGGELASRAAARPNTDLVRSLRDLQVRMVAADQAGDFGALEALNHEFHRAINLAGWSRKLIWVFRMTTGFAPTRSYGSISGWSEASVHDHDAIIDALESQDAERSRRMMQDHVSHAGELLVEHLSAIGFWGEDSVDN
jgi:DNA-binding GntR family transcriptional regulator